MMILEEGWRNLFLVIKEALHNIVKHSKADLCYISFSYNENLEIKISDNGIGLSTNQNPHGNGLKNMTERITHLGGQIDIESENDGLEITIFLPQTSD